MSQEAHKILKCLFYFQNGYKPAKIKESFNFQTQKQSSEDEFVPPSRKIETRVLKPPYTRQ